MKLASQQIQAVDAIHRWRTHSASQVFRLFGYAGSGKSGSLTSTIQTPNGPTLMRDVQLGQEVFGSDGNPTKVTGIFPQGPLQAYRVTFRDGFSTECSADHLWAVWTTKLKQNKRPPKILTTQEIVGTGLRFTSGIYRFSIPLCNPVAYSYKKHPIPPYTLGACLGDGTALGRTPTLILSDEQIIQRVSTELPEYVITHTVASGCVQYRLTWPKEHRKNPLSQAFRELGLNILAKDKFIPNDYLRGSITQRWELLKGLMDTDGSCRKNRTSFSTTSEKLADNICTLVQSLGGIAIKQVRDRRSEEKSIEYHINVKTFKNPFHIQSKAKNWKLSWKNPPSRAIISIEPTEVKEHQCISVSANDNLYLADHFIVTHNTTMAKYIAESCKIPMFGAYTGKASHVLRQKGCEAYTIHQLIYSPQDRSKKRLQGLEVDLLKLENPEDPKDIDLVAIERLRKEIAAENRKLSSPKFKLNPDGPIKDADLVIIDEVSMVNKEMAKDLLSFGIKILVLGDPAQLPPIFGAGYFIDAKPDFVLTEIHRQARDNPIIRLATGIRQGRLPSIDGDMVVAAGSITPEEALQYDQILVGKNDTRKATNQRVRNLNLLTSELPVTGDKLVCLRNDHEVGLLNGALWNVESCYNLNDDDKLDLLLRNEDHSCVAVEAHTHHFLDMENTKIPWWIAKEAQEFDYGYALTVHKSQGSQWPSVLVFDESDVFRQDKFKHLYTACTRASEKLKLVLP